MACCRPSTIAKAHLGSSAYTILIAKTCAQKQSVDARDVRYLATRAREALIYKEIASWAVRDAFPKWQEGRHPHCHFRGLLRLHSRYGPPDRSAAHRRPLSRGSNPCGYPHKPLVSYRITRQLSGWIPPPLMIRAFGAHCHNPTCPLPNRRDDAVTFHDGAAIGMGEIPDHYEDAVVIPSRGYPAL